MGTLRKFLVFIVFVFVVMFVLNTLIMKTFFGIEKEDVFAGFGAPVDKVVRAIDYFRVKENLNRFLKGNQDKYKAGRSGFKYEVDTAYYAGVLDGENKKVFGGGISGNNTESGMAIMAGKGDESSEITGFDFYISPEEIMMLKRLSLTDKLKALSIASKISNGDLNRIINLAKDGITYDEASELAEFARKNLNPGDIKALISMLDKNGFRKLSGQAEYILRLAGTLN